MQRRRRFKKRWLLFGTALLLGLFVWRVGMRAPQIEPGSVLLMTLEGEYFEGVTHPLLGLFGLEENSLVLEVARLRRAARDTRIKTVLLRVKDLQLGWGRAAELRQALSAFNAADGKQSIALLETEGGGNAAYFVASAAHEVYVTPAQQLPFVGLASEAWYLGGLFEKLGVAVEYERIGRYKNAAERYAHAGPSEASRRMNRALFDSLDETFVSAVAASRKLEPRALRAHMDAGPVTPAELQQAGLVDGESDAEALLTKLGEPPRVTAERYDGVTLADLGVEPEARFALVYGVGPVVTGEGDGGDSVLAADTVIENLERAAADDDIAALVLRINSPGGSPLASDLVWRALREIEKPVVVSMSDLAASGGYYVASAADYIVSQPATLTGSIGVFALRPSFKGLYKKLGIAVERHTRGARADLWLSDAPLSAPAREVLTRMVESIYAKFLARVVAGRPEHFETPAAVHAIAQGRVWTGTQALEHGLVDELGGLAEALDAARKLAGLPSAAEVELVEYGTPEPGFAHLLDWLTVSARRGALLPRARGVATNSVTGTAPYLYRDAAAAAAFAPAPLLQMAHTLLLFPPGAPLLLPEHWVEFR